MDWDFERDLDVPYGNKDASFSANDSEIFVLVSGGYDTTRLVGYMPDQDEDGVDDSKDQCPESPLKRNRIHRVAHRANEILMEMESMTNSMTALARRIPHLSMRRVAQSLNCWIQMVME